MRVTVHPGNRVAGEVAVPGDKSIAHRWLILAATADGRSELRRLPNALDVRSTARVLAAITRSTAGPALERWASEPAVADEGDRSTSNGPRPRATAIALDARGRGALEAPDATLDCGNSGTTMRLVAGVLASAPFRSVLTGDASVSSRPMDRVADPLREMGAEVVTVDGHAPITLSGGPLTAIEHRSTIPSAQVKGAVLLAGLAADGETSVVEPAPTRDHTERALLALGAPITVSDGRVSLRAFQHAGFAAAVPGDISSATFVMVAAILTGGRVRIDGVGLNPSRSRLLEVLRRAGVDIHVEVEGSELGEPIGSIVAEGTRGVRAVAVDAGELPLVIDEVPALAMLAAHGDGDSWFRGAGELRVKESDRLAGLAAAIRELGGRAAVEGDDLVVGGGGLMGGIVDASGDHRMAMAAFAGAVAARGDVTIAGMEAADVSFPAFVGTMRRLGAEVSG